MDGADVAAAVVTAALADVTVIAAAMVVTVVVVVIMVAMVVTSVIVVVAAMVATVVMAAMVVTAVATAVVAPTVNIRILEMVSIHIIAVGLEISQYVAPAHLRVNANLENAGVFQENVLLLLVIIMSYLLADSRKNVKFVQTP